MQAGSITCLNGVFMPAEAATVPVSDRGFRFGDGVFETMRLENGVPYQFEAHLTRMNAGLAALHITPPEVDWHSIARALIARNHATSGTLRLAVSRGSGSRGYVPNADIATHWVMEYMPAVALPESPYKLWLSTITRPPLSSLPANYKLAHGIGSTLALLEAREQHCDEALLLTSDGAISEAAAANIFWIASGEIFTPALLTSCLAGTTRTAIMRLAKVQEVVTDISTLHDAEAVFLTNVRLGIWPVAQLFSASPLQDKNPPTSYNIIHPLLVALQQKLEEDRASYIAAHQATWTTQ